MVVVVVVVVVYLSVYLQFWKRSNSARFPPFSKVTTSIKGPDKPTCQLLPITTKQMWMRWERQERERRWCKTGAVCDSVVCVWNIWIDVKLLPVDVHVFHEFSPFKEFHTADDHVYTTVSSSIFTAGGQCTTDRHCPTKTLSVRGDTEPDQLCVPASFFRISLNGNRLSLEPAWRQFWISNVHFNFCAVFAICQGGNDLALLKGKGQLPTHFI